MAEDVWILGIHMTKFGKHPDKDTVDLAAEAALGALRDGGVTIHDIGVLAAGNLMNANAGIGQQLQKQIGQTGIPVYNVVNACATGATALRTVIMAVKAGEADMGLAVGVEKLAGAGEKPSEDDWEAFQDKVKDLGDVGTPDDIDDDARDGFETFVDIVVDSDYDDAKDFAKGLPGASAKEQANAEGFVTYAITTCTEVPEQ